LLALATTALEQTHNFARSYHFPYFVLRPLDAITVALQFALSSFARQCSILGVAYCLLCFAIFTLFVREVLAVAKRQHI
jgi:hypothetical protein